MKGAYNPNYWTFATPTGVDTFQMKGAYNTSGFQYRHPLGVDTFQMKGAYNKELGASVLVMV